MGRNLGTSLGDICRLLYILGLCSVLTGRLWEGGVEELELQRCRGAGAAVMEIIGCAMR